MDFVDLEWAPCISGKTATSSRRLKMFGNICPIKFRPLLEVTLVTLAFNVSASASLCSKWMSASTSPVLTSLWLLLAHVFCISTPLFCGLSSFSFLSGCVVYNFRISLEEIKFLQIHLLHKWWKSSPPRLSHMEQSRGDCLCHAPQS